MAVLPLTRTVERENQFTWLVKMATQRFGPIAKADSNTPSETLEQIRPLRIVVMRGSPTYDYLLKNKFKPEQILVESTLENMFKALDKGLVDVIYGSEQINSAVIASSGRKMNHYRFGSTISLGDIWLAGSKDFSASDIQLLQQAMAELQKDGSYARLMKKYKLKP
ncbi:MAG: transporter substrate-binding domain-containing protein [Burkholderiales bacterium]|nr:transporter substrate-binding domain-containing protein [Burkholderiales bacterium]